MNKNTGVGWEGMVLQSSFVIISETANFCFYCRDNREHPMVL
jgi:hypothetical protein